MNMKFLFQIMIVSLILLIQPACSINGLSVRFSSALIEHEISVLNQENDLKKVEFLLPKNITRLEQLLLIDQRNKNLHVYASQAYYSYAFAFVEDKNIKQAISLYKRSFQHAKAALELHGVSRSDLLGNSSHLRKKIGKLPKQAVDAIYWVALSWARLIEIKQPDILLLTQLHKTAILMQQVVRFDEAYQLGGPYLFFAVYYSGRSHYLGGNDFLAGQYFERARELNHNRLLIVDFLQAKYLNGRVNGKENLISVYSVLSGAG